MTLAIPYAERRTEMSEEVEKHAQITNEDEVERQAIETVKSRILEEIRADVKLAEQNPGAYSKSNHYQYSKH